MRLRRLRLLVALVAAVSLCLPPGVAQAENPIRRAFPQQWNAYESNYQPTRHWALIVGITAYDSPTRDTYGGRRDALLIKQRLLNLGWRSNHILTLLDEQATKSMILGGLAWLRSKATPGSTVVFAYAGHEKPLRSTADGDNEARDMALHTNDNRYIYDGDLARALGAVPSKYMWIHFATCRAAGFNDPGMMRDGRLATFSSPASELSYEQPAWDLSVIGKYMVESAMLRRYGDINGDGRITVEEAFWFAKPRVERYTSERQHPVIADRIPGGLLLGTWRPVT